jgi:cell division protease FtsH
MNKIMVYLAGRIAVEIKYKEKFSNAHMDIKKAKDLAYKMIRDYAMGDSLVGDESEVAKVLKNAEDEVKGIYTSSEMLIEKVYEFLLKNEVVHKEDIEKLKNEIF